LADFGTRLKATFSGVPVGVHIFVSVANVLNNVTPLVFPAGFVAGSNNTFSFAQLVAPETAADSVSSNITTFSTLPLVAATDNASGGVQIAEITPTTGAVAGGIYTATWEVVNTNPSVVETLKFAVYDSFTANAGANTPPAGSATVTLSFAPTPSASTFTATAAAAASASLPIPRFSIGGLAASNVLTIQICRTILLYPFITNQSGFDTGIAIANTSTDPFGTVPQAGTCTLKWFGGTTTTGTTPPAGTPAAGNPADIVTASIPSGTVYTNLASTAVSGFQGYMIAVCNFQFAHGFAFISDLGARNLAMGYLALVIPDPGTSGKDGSRTATPPCQGIAGCSTTGENTSH